MFEHRSDLVEIWAAAFPGGSTIDGGRQGAATLPNLVARVNNIGAWRTNRI